MGRILSGVQATGREGPHIGNYIGAFKQWAALQDEHESLLCVVDLHSMTVEWNPQQLKESTRAMVAFLVACGIDPHRSVLFAQSDVPHHTELSWILTCISKMGELSRMTQFKEKGRGKEAGAVGVGLFMYPVLMAADVLVYRADLVPVGDDQRQHLELMRDLAERFNRMFGETFPIPEAFIPKEGARIMSLDQPKEKMSKSSDRPTGQIWLLDSPDAVKKKISRAVTDSGQDIRHSPDKPAISNLLELFAGATGKSVANIEKDYTEGGYAKFKADLADAINELLGPIQATYGELMDDPAQLDKILDLGAERAEVLAEETMKTVREKVGL